MKRCTACFRYSLGDPPYCTHCGRTYDVRLCPRGHRNPRGALFCAECGSGDLSTPAPPPTLLFHVSQWALNALIPITIVLIGVTAVLGLLMSLDWDQLTPRLVLLVMLVGFLYWTTTLLPGPVRRVGKTAAKALWRSTGRKRDHHRQ
jgi:hypothetical protein